MQFLEILIERLLLEIDLDYILRQEIFLDDLAHLTVHFEKALSLASDGSSQPATTSPWGWQAVASLIENDSMPNK